MGANNDNRTFFITAKILTMAQIQAQKIGIFFKGLASTPSSVGVQNWTTGQIFEEHIITETKGDEIRKTYDKLCKMLSKKYKYLINC